ncbi:MAG: tetratricopeptide repeat protein [Planctomycetota bacterium]
MAKRPVDPESARYSAHSALGFECCDRLGELGNLYSAIGRYEESVRFYRQAADIYFELADFAEEGVTRSNLADPFIKRKRYDEARAELRRAIDCMKPFGHAVEPWTT